VGIKLLADRMIDLTDEELRELDIDTISCYINMGGKSYSDLEDVFPDDVFAYMDATGQVAQTAAKSPAIYSEFFGKYVAQGHTVIHLAVSSGISSIAANAKLAAQDYPGKVFVIDTLLLSNGIALLAMFALERLAAGETDAARLAADIEAKIPKIQASFLIDSLDCIYRGGRCNGLTYYAANIFKIKPAIHMNAQGQMVPRTKFRGARERVLEPYIKSTFEYRPDPDLRLLYVIQSTYDAEIEQTMREIIERYHHFDEIRFNTVSCNCCVHGGRNTVGLFYMCK